MPSMPPAGVLIPTVMSFLLSREPVAVGTGPGLAHSDPRLHTQCLVCQSGSVGIGGEGAISSPATPVASSLRLQWTLFHSETSIPETQL